jgi:DNA mismatch endonuclease, patch repair protein
VVDRISKDARSRNMARIRGRETAPELALRRALWAMGLRYRTHGSVPGRPDIVFSQARLAVFVDGCFWHSCPEHGVRPKGNRLFWAEKLRGNRQRDRRNEAALRALGWTYIRFWEHDIEQRLDQCAAAVQAALNKKQRAAKVAASRARKNEGPRARAGRP